MRASGDGQRAKRRRAARPLAYLLAHAIPPPSLAFVQGDDEDTSAILAVVELPLTFISKHLQQWSAFSGAPPTAERRTIGKCAALAPSQKALRPFLSRP